MTLTIDSQPCDLPREPIAVPGWDARDLNDPERCREGRTLRLTLPVTPANDRALAFARDPHGDGSFDKAPHRAELSAEGTVLLAGTVRLLSAGDGGYVAELRTGGARWAKHAARTMFNRIPVTFATTLTPAAVCAGWSDGAPLKFLPVHRDEYPRLNGSADLLPAERLLSTDDCHPFLHIATLVEAIVAEAGYRIESRFFETAFFHSLYMSGAYSARDTEALRGRMDFRAGRTAAATAAADNLGRIHATPAGAGDTVGNLFETAQPVAGDDATADLFDNGHCFAKEGIGIRFRPPTEISAGFEYFLRYTTAHRILTRERLRGIDSVMLGPGCDLRFALANRYPDRRESLATGYDYRIIVFGHRAGAQYRLTCTRNGTAGTLWAEFAARTTLLSTPSSGTCSDPALLVRDGNAWIPCAGDWALYDGTLRTVVHYKDYEPMFDHYGVPPYIAGFNVSAIAWKTDRWNISRLDNSFQLSGVMLLDSSVDSEEQADEIVRTAERKFAGNPGQVMFVIKEGEENDHSRFIPIASQNEGDWTALHEQAVSDIVVAHSWFRTLSGLDYAAGFNAERILHEYEIALNTVIRSQQTELLGPIRTLIGRIRGLDASSLEIVNRPPTRSKPIYMKVWEARKADGLDYDPDDTRQQAFLSEITRYNIRSIE